MRVRLQIVEPAGTDSPSSSVLIQTLEAAFGDAQRIMTGATQPEPEPEPEPQPEPEPEPEPVPEAVSTAVLADAKLYPDSSAATTLSPAVSDRCPRSFGATFWILGVKTERTAKRRRKNEQWARYGLRQRVRAAVLYSRGPYPSLPLG